MQSGTREETPLKQFEITLVQGVHFLAVEEYFHELAESFCLVGWLDIPALSTLKQLMTIKESKDYRQTLLEGVFLQDPCQKSFFLRERKFFSQNVIEYYLSHSQSQATETDKTDVKVLLKKQIQMNFDQQISKRLIKIIVMQYTQSPLLHLFFSSLKKIGSKSYVYKQNFIEKTLYQEIIFPSIKPDLVKNRITNTNNEIILMVHQKNMRELPFFQKIIEQTLKTGHQIPKIIGHPVSLILTLLIDKDHKYDHRIGSILANYKKLSFFQNNSKIDPQAAIFRLQLLLGQVLGEQNMLESSFVDFLSQNLSNDQFLQNFIKLTTLYYKTFLNLQIEPAEIQDAIMNNFFISPEAETFNNTNYFTTLLKAIEFKHDQYYKNVLFQIETKNLISINNKPLRQITLMEMYKYNGVEFTFIGMDLNDQVVRFFNFMTAPKLPISAIMALMQILPAPYKSFIWKEEWGKYRYYQNGLAHLVSLTGHQIIDSQFLLESPLEIIEDPSIRQNYFCKNTRQNCKIKVVSSSRLKIEGVQSVEDIKSLLKVMKNSAIDSLPKIRLIWKILTSSNRVEIDINNVQTLCQIPILQKTIKLNQTFIKYLPNLNKEANNSRILSIFPHFYPTPKLPICEITSNIERMLVLICSTFRTQSDHPLLDRSKNDLQLQLNDLEDQIKKRSLMTYCQVLNILTRYKILIHQYDLKGKCLYKDVINKFQKTLEEQGLIDSDQAKNRLENVLKEIRKGEFQGNHMREFYQESDIGSQTYMKESHHFEGVDNEESAFGEIEDILRVFYQKLKNIRRLAKTSSDSQEGLNLEYQRIVYRVCLSLNSIFSKKKQTKQLKQFRREFFQLSPQLYNISLLFSSKLQVNSRIRTFLLLNNEGKPFHLILSCPIGKLLQEAHFAIAIRERIESCRMKKIETITPSGYSSVLAFLLCLNISKQEIFLEVVGLEALVRTMVADPDDKNFNILELLARRVDSQQKLYYFGSQKKLGQLKTTLRRKYSKLDNLFSAFQDSIQKSNSYKIAQLYLLLNEYDTYLTDEQIIKKEGEIQKYLLQRLQDIKQTVNKYELLIENDSMLKQKLIFNRIGIKFSLSFLFHGSAASDNWESIHKGLYHDLTLLKMHLIQLFRKFNIKPDITLAQFNRRNYHQIKLEFCVADQTELQFERIDEERHPHVKLIDLMIVSVSSPVYFGAYPLPTHSKQNSAFVSVLSDKLQGKFRPSTAHNRYWSNNTLNPFPFNLIQKHHQDQSVIALDLTNVLDVVTADMSGFNDHLLKKNKSDQEKRNLKALDLISFWWSKPQKLTPELKEIMFSNIFKSPFSRFYFFMMKHSDNYLSTAPSAWIVNLQDEQDFFLKSKIIASMITSSTNPSMYTLKLTTIDSEHTSIQCIKSSPSRQLILIHNDIQISQSDQITVKNEDKKIQLTLCLIDNGQIQKIKFRLSKISVQGLPQYFEIQLKKAGIVQIAEITIEGGELRRSIIGVEEEEKTVYCFYHCRNCGHSLQLLEVDSFAYCRLCQQQNEFKLARALPESDDETEEREETAIDKAEVDPRKKEEQQSWVSRYLCCGCMGRSIKREDSY